ncbi:Tryptophan--tRNA ligase [Methylacidimicrobium sp. AP8]|uniref:tryptophan--tRNA ligase n=1 Tax=Methylacidimicrobium sp. AP8 TaxID=2730359 RepID=UPI0018C049F8|nr:tryptophan--tRNA ligase [Methylacidimicrobium sp. AP8]CAB4244196.1 Tryptophan--tRNA ligase [Methylacidimicrobium sp. AP8]
MRILSGIQPSGFLHLGNYFGMMRRAIQWQEKGETFLFIADFHALTTVGDPEALRRNVREAALAFLACGLDPKRTVFFRQSAVPEVLELAWLLSSVTPVGLLERCHSYKDKLAKGIVPTHALFAYPVLMAADILLYRADVVPVGIDQKQHLEVTRDLAAKFNQAFGPVFVMPKEDIEENVASVPGIDGQKMSKSYGNTLELFGDREEFRRRVMAIRTDSTPIEEPKPIAGSVLVSLYRLVSEPQEFEEFVAAMRRGGVGYGALKKELLAKLERFLEPFRRRYEEIKGKPGFVEEILEEGARTARAAAAPTLESARRAVGLL